MAAAHGGIGAIDRQHGGDLGRIGGLAGDGCIQYRSQGLIDNVLHHKVGCVVAAGSFAFATVILKIDGTSGKYLLVGILAASFFEDGEFLLLGLSVRKCLLSFLAFNNCQCFRRYAQLEFE